MDKRSTIVRNHDITAYVERLIRERYGNLDRTQPTERSKRTAKRRIDRSLDLRFRKYLDDDI